MYSDHIRQKLLDKQTPQERRLYAVLDMLGASYIPQYVIPYGSSFMVVDCYLPSHGLIIELDGLHHILDPVMCAEDCARDEYLEKMHGYRVIRYLNSVAMDSKNFNKIIGDLLSPLMQTKLG